MAPFEILFVVKLRFAIEAPNVIHGEELLANALLFELAQALINRTECIVLRIDKGEVHNQIGDVVLLRKNNN